MVKQEKKKPGRTSYRDMAKLPKYASHKVKVQHNANMAKADSTMTLYRKGFQLMWRVVPGIMKKAKVKPPGEYDEGNGHGGVMPGWPDECTLTNQRVSKIMFGCIQSKACTQSQLKKIRKTLGYMWELTGKRTKTETNWPCIGMLMESIRPGQVLPNQKGTGSKARYIPSPEQLQAAIERGWTPEHEWSLLKWSTHYLCFHDTMICGARPQVDLGKVKESREHDVNYAQGWQKTAFKGGRSKLHKAKRGTRPWSMWRTCLCQGDKHVRPTEEAYKLDENGNPDVLSWDPRCPVATVEFIFQNQLAEDEPKRCYPNTLEKNKAGQGVRYGEKSIAYPAKAAVEFMEVQGLPKFDTNSGRKALARWCKKLSVPYELSVHIHGDLPDTWAKHYEKAVEQPQKNMIIREQSRDPEQATAALRCFAEWLGRGFNPYQRPMNLLERQQDAMMTLFGPMLGFKDLARNLRMGMTAADAMKACKDIPPAVLLPKPEPKPEPEPKIPQKRKRKKSESPDLMKYMVDSDDDLLEFRPRKKLKPSQKPAPKKPKPKQKQKPKPKVKRRTPKKKTSKPKPKARKRKTRKKKGKG